MVREILILTLVELGYQGWITIESFGFRLGELSASAPIWRDLAPTPEAIAFDGLEFLSRLPESVRARS